MLAWIRVDKYQAVPSQQMKCDFGIFCKVVSRRPTSEI